MGSVGNNSLSKLDSGAVNQFRQGVNAVLSDFGISSKDIIYKASNDDRLFAQVQEENGKTVVYLGADFKNFEELEKQLRRNPSNGITSTLPVFFTGIHESGHIVEQQLTPYGPHSTDLFSREIVEGAQRDVRKAGLSAAKSQISEYAAKDNHETIAEAFVDYYNNGDSAKPLSRAIMKRLQRYRKN